MALFFYNIELFWEVEVPKQTLATTLHGTFNKFSWIQRISTQLEHSVRPKKKKKKKKDCSWVNSKANRTNGACGIVV